MKIAEIIGIIFAGTVGLALGAVTLAVFLVLASPVLLILWFAIALMFGHNGYTDGFG